MYMLKLLMDPMLNCFYPEYKRIFCLDYVAFRLENAGLVDVQAIREKVTTQLVINIHNELQVPLARQFIAKHVPHLLH
ncbi:uncharacterized protein [Lolium perenne]|uniref:uncharacterized protein isoform X3 n=1 Tax=Lolium perenne TaxID=4522 RepID=UPI003A9960C4